MARINGYHSGKGRYDHAYDYVDGRFVKIDLDDVEELLFGAEFEFEFDEDDDDRNEADNHEYIEVYSSDYDEYFEIDNPHYDPDYDDNSASAIADNLPDMPIYHLENDGSLNHGFELITMPMTRRALLAFTEQGWFKDLVDRSQGDAGSNGLHIHVSKKEIVYRSRMMYQWLAVRRALEDNYRYSSSYCEFPYYDNLEDFYERNKNGYRHDDRYKCINFGNRSTIEFRLFNMVDYDMHGHMVRCLNTIESTIENATKYTLDELYVRNTTFRPDGTIGVGKDVVRELPEMPERVSSATINSTRIVQDDGELRAQPSVSSMSANPTDRTMFFVGSRVRLNLNLLNFYFTNYDSIHANREIYDLIDPERFNLNSYMMSELNGYGRSQVYEIAHINEQRQAVTLRILDGSTVGWSFHPRWLFGVE